MKFNALKLDLTLNAKAIKHLTIQGFFADEKIAKSSPYFGSKLGDLTTVPAQKTVYYCLGKRKEFTRRHLETVFHALLTSRFSHASYKLGSFRVGKLFATEILETFLTALFQTRFPLQTHKKTKQALLELKIDCQTSISANRFETMVQKQMLLAQSSTFCRNLQNEAPNLMFPAAFANQIAAEVKNLPQIKLEIWDEKKLAQENFNLFLAVAAGSAHPPRFLKLTYQGKPTTTFQTALLGKGITFDTGGYSLKPSAYQKHMKYDMSGAAIVCSTILAIARLKLPVNVTALACLSENLIGRDATLVESVIKAKAGLSVEITNTDAEGRLVLADAITYAIKALKVNQIIELSTLTGAITVALGDHITGAFANNDKLYQQFAKACQTAREPLWRLPVAEYNHKLMRQSKFADLINASSDYRGGASNAAAFLFAFAGKKPFLHLDIAGTATTPHANKEGTAVMLKSLLTFFASKN